MRRGAGREWSVFLGVSGGIGMERKSFEKSEATYLPQAGPAGAHPDADAGFIARWRWEGLYRRKMRLEGYEEDVGFGTQGLAAGGRRGPRGVWWGWNPGAG